MRVVGGEMLDCIQDLMYLFHALRNQILLTMVQKFCSSLLHFCSSVRRMFEDNISAKSDSDTFSGSTLCRPCSATC